MKKTLLAVLTAILTLSILCFAGCGQSSGTHKSHEYENYICKYCGAEYYSEGLHYRMLQAETGYGVIGIDDATATEIIIPSTYNGWSVFIENETFCNNEIIEKVYIHNGVTTIGDSAFKNCSNLVSVTIPDSVTSIGNYAFDDCNNLKYNEYDNAYYLGNDTNPYLWLMKVKSTEIESCNINENCKYIRAYAFRDCSSLTSITIPDTITTIGEDTFNGCSSLEYNDYDNAYYLGNKNNPYLCLIEAKSTEIESCSINENCKFIYDSAFHSKIVDDSGSVNCSSLTSITIPDSVTSIGNSAFAYCTNLTNITIPNSVIYIGDFAFYNCDSLTSITIPDSINHISNSAFDYCDSLTSITIPNNVTSADYYAFDYCYNLKYNEYDNAYYLGSDTNPYLCLIKAKSNEIESCNINEKCKVIQIGAFSYCDNLTNIIIPNSVTSIGAYAFYDCSNLTSITIGNGVKSIDFAAFYDCNNLTSVTIPASVTAISYGVFSDCDNLKNISVNEKNTIYKSINGNLYSKDAKSLIQYAIGKTNETFSIPKGTTSISDAAFAYCKNLSSVIIPNSITSIGYYAFSDCNSLTSVTIPNSVTFIGNSAFSSCSSLESITIPDSVTSIGSYAFSSCSSLESITIPDSVTSIGSYAFSSCSSLTSVTIPSSITSIGSYAFSSCSSLTSITIPNSVTSIGNSAFSNCSSLTNVVIGNSVTSIGNDTFSNCSSLTSITVDESNTNYSSFDGILYNKNQTEFIHIPNAITSVTIPDSVTSIGDFAFYECYNLISITIPDSVTSIGNYAFCYCSSLTSVTIPDSVTSIGYWAFSDCSSLEKIYYKGTWEEWDKSEIKYYKKNYLKNVEVYFYSEVELIAYGNFWHYVDGIPTVWE